MKNMKWGMLAAFLLQVNPLSASQPITPYVETGFSGNFRYAVYNNRWLPHGKRRSEEKDITRVAITGILPGAEGNIVIPSTIEGHQVYGIDEMALKSVTGVTGITLPKTLRFLRPGTLNQCGDLQSIFVADNHPDFASVDGVMFNKERTKLLAFGAGRGGHYNVPDGTKAIGPNAFALCTQLTRVTIPNSVIDIGGRAGGVFQGCANLEHIDISDTVTNIGQKSFQDCGKLGTFTIPPKITAIPFGLFQGCRRLTSVTLPDGITRIGNYAFADCTQLTLKAFPDKLTTIGAYAFKNCQWLRRLTVPRSVTSIGRGAFDGSGVVLPDNPAGIDGK